jgi:hypothetical protein
VIRGRRLLLAAATWSAAVAALASPAPSGARTTALAVQTIGPGRAVTASDGRVHVEHNLVLTNAFVGDVTLRSLTVRAGRRVLQRLKGPRLAAHTHPILREQIPLQVLAPSTTAAVVVDVVLPRGAAVPRRLTDEVTYTLPKRFPPNAVIEGRTVTAPAVNVPRDRRLVIASPLRGRGWWVGGGCCHPDQRHRAVLLADDGRLVPTEMFDIDWLQIAGGRLFTGDGKKLTDYPGFGARVYAATSGRVVKVVNDKPEAPLTGPNPDLDGPDDFGGNSVVVRMSRHRYAFYAHFQPGSVRVRVGDHVRPGRVLGLLGNSGNSAAPHLHFGIHDGPDPATSASLPWVFGRYRYQGSGDVTPDGRVPLTGRAHRVRDAYPLNLSSLVLR